MEEPHQRHRWLESDSKIATHQEPWLWSLAVKQWPGSLYIFNGDLLPNKQWFLRPCVESLMSFTNRKWASTQHRKEGEKLSARLGNSSSLISRHRYGCILKQKFVCKSLTFLRLETNLLKCETFSRTFLPSLFLVFC